VHLSKMVVLELTSSYLVMNWCFCHVLWFC